MAPWNSGPGGAWLVGQVDEADFCVDAVGLKCPEPLMIVRNRVRGMAAGETVAIEATDPSTVRDFVNFCRFMGHVLERNEQLGDRFHFVIRKGGAGSS